MSVNVIKAERIVRTMLGLLERDVMLPSLVWRDAGGDFRGAKNDTISIRLPAYFNARQRDLRSGATRTKDSLHERVVTVTLDKDIYGVIPITDEELTLDIELFNEQIAAPVANGIVRSLEDELVALMSGATYAKTVASAASAPYDAVVDVRRYLNDARVPQEGRVIVVGSGLEAAILKDDQFVRFDQAGDSSAFRSGLIGRIAGLPVVTSTALDPDEGYGFHRTAYVLSSKAPFVPRGVAWGASLAWNGFALRVAQQVDPDDLVDNFHADAWVGTNVVLDDGYFNAAGKFIPNEQAEAAALTVTTSANTDDIIDFTAPHGLSVGDRIVFSSLTGGTGLSVGQGYTVATDEGGSGVTLEDDEGTAVDFTSDVTAGTAYVGGAKQLVRAVKITA